MANYQLGEIVYVDLNPTKGVETNKLRPCVIVSNNQYNEYLNTVIVAPDSNASKYMTEARYIESPLLIKIPENLAVSGTILLQHLRSIDPKVRIKNKPIDQLPSSTIKEIQNVIKNFFNIIPKEVSHF